MPIVVTCTGCGASIKAPDDAAGKKVKCPKCTTVLPVPESVAAADAIQATTPPPRVAAADDWDDEPRKRRRRSDDDFDETQPRRRDIRARSSGGVNGLAIAGMVLGIVGIVVVFIPCVGWLLGILLGIVGAILSGIGLGTASSAGSGKGLAIAGLVLSILAVIWVPVYIFIVVGLVFHSAADAARQAQKAIEIQQQIIKNNPNVDPAKGPLTPVSGELTLVNGQATVQGALTVKDARDRLRPLAVCKVYSVKMTAGTTYQIDMMKSDPREQLDPYLRLENAAGNNLAQDDDGGEGLNARILFVCPATDTYRVVATTFGGSIGNYTLRVQEK
ncbi:MAG: hypothetical protein NZO58_00220 [Gemmataceae bacterium]|nr:hypothetical protein [Gemmataceae bacterium]